MASVYTVAQVTSYISHLFEEDFALKRISIQGEISNCKKHSGGHLYFTLKDETSTLSCVMFASNRAKLTFIPSEGMRVIARGSVRIYERDGVYQLYVTQLEPAGVGEWFRLFEERKAQFEEMGMFSEEYKKPIPRFAKKVGVVTAKTGAAIQDIINITHRRNPYVQLILYPTLVQGESAAVNIAAGIDYLDTLGLDVIIVGRGGGSIEDLWAFNEEKVAHAVAASSIPIISAVGHETDVTICDFVADCRAATPSAAAELAVPDQLELKDTLRSYQFTLTHLIRARMRNYHEQLHRLVASKSFQTPQTRVAMETMRLDRYTEQLSVAMKRKTEAEAHRLSKLSGQLHTLSPLQVLSRGYAITQDKNQQTIKSTAQVCTGQQITVTLSDGVLDCTVDEVKCNE